LNVLPEAISGRLKDGPATIADYYASVSVLFADVVGFTAMSSGSGPEKMIGVLNDIFSAFDELAVKYGVEKIRTIGDGYMAVCGAPVERDDHALALAQMALDMLAYDMPLVDGKQCQLRIGINSGEVIAGVVGTTKFHYDVWGDAVNIAARMESQGEPGRIQLGPGAHALLRDDFDCELRGEQDIKGKGVMQTWWLERG
jgi:class 3 adenylate cyclase